MSAGPARYRKKPLAVEAVQATEDPAQAQAIITWVRSNGGVAQVEGYGENLVTGSVTTLEGDMAWGPGDWIIRGVAGEFYPCKAAIFAASYEPADDTL